ncbi:MAG TPA: thiamine pyrophosphate-binding protein [Candidatus Saccharimonadales bacterium]|nr:thiamine pyrophosphate-binding protein [Candidatus Saccharimonadales bacterium]
MPDVATERPRTDAAQRTDGGALMARTLREHGVRTVFALPGGHILPFLDASIDEDLRIIDTRHEGAAVLAAEGWALATGETGVAAVTAGPGFANGLIGLLDAAAWSVPLLMLAGRTSRNRQGRGAVADIDQRAIAAPIAKWAATCSDTGRIPRNVAEALHRARTGCPGAVYLEVDSHAVYGNAAPLDVVPSGFPLVPGHAAGAPADIGAAVAAFAAAERPIIVAGSGAFWSAAGAEIGRFAELAQIPVITASAARGVVADSHPWSLGSLVHGGVAIPSADCVLVLGSAFNANVMYGGAPLFGSDQTIVQVDIAPERIGGNRAADVTVIGDIAAVMRDCCDARAATPPGREEWLSRARSLAGASLGFWNRQVDEHTREKIHAGAAARALAAFVQERFSGRATLVADGGDALAWALAYFGAELPGHLLTTTTALGTLGVGMPFALAAQAARPDERVFLFTGDGAFGLSAMEVATAVRHRLPVIVIVSNNAGWGDVRYEQDELFGPGRHVASSLPGVRYDRFAEALGGHGERVERLADLEPALERSIDSGLCSVIDVQTDPAVISELLRMVAQLGLM